MTSDVPASIVTELRNLGAEIENIPDGGCSCRIILLLVDSSIYVGQGVAAGMFYRFLVAADSSVDRYIIRDVDSRLNARDR